MPATFIQDAHSTQTVATQTPPNTPTIYHPGSRFPSFSSVVDALLNKKEKPSRYPRCAPPILTRSQVNTIWAQPALSIIRKHMIGGEVVPEDVHYCIKWKVACSACSFDKQELLHIHLFQRIIFLEHEDPDISYIIIRILEARGNILSFEVVAYSKSGHSVIRQEDTGFWSFVLQIRGFEWEFINPDILPRKWRKQNIKKGFLQELSWERRL